MENTHNLVIFFLSLVGVNVFKILVILEKVPSEVEDGPGDDLLLDCETNIEVNGERGSVVVRHLLSRVRGNCRRREEVKERIYFDFLGESLVRGLGTCNTEEIKICNTCSGVSSLYTFFGFNFLDFNGFLGDILAFFPVDWASLTSNKKWKVSVERS